MALRADSNGSKVFKVLKTSAYISEEAYLRDAEENDTDIIYVKNGLYAAEEVTPSGTYDTSDVTGGKKYAFKQRGRTYINYGDISFELNENYRVKYTVSSNGETAISSGSVYYNLSSTGGSGKVQLGPFNGVYVYANKLNGPLYRAHKKSTVVIQKKVNGSWVTQSGLDPGSGSVNFGFTVGASTEVGSVTVLDSVAPTYSGKTLVPAVLTKETTTDKKYAPWIYIQSEKSEETKTFLVQGASTAVQNFAFDGMEDVYDE